VVESFGIEVGTQFDDDDDDDDDDDENCARNGDHYSSIDTVDESYKKKLGGEPKKQDKPSPPDYIWAATQQPHHAYIHPATDFTEEVMMPRTLMAFEEKPQTAKTRNSVASSRGIEKQESKASLQSTATLPAEEFTETENEALVEKDIASVEQGSQTDLHVAQVQEPNDDDTENAELGIKPNTATMVKPKSRASEFRITDEPDISEDLQPWTDDAQKVPVDDKSLQLSPERETTPATSLDVSETASVESLPEPNLLISPCQGCNLPFTSSDTILEAIGFNWHPTCFRCSGPSCEKELGNDVFYQRHKHAYCDKCWGDEFCPKCTRCALPIREVTLRIWHPFFWRPLNLSGIDNIT
jgi:hypothetical protein